MENQNSVIFDDVKSVLLESDPNEFDIDKYINELEQIKKKYKNLHWSNDEYDNWHNE